MKSMNQEQPDNMVLGNPRIFMQDKQRFVIGLVWHTADGVAGIQREARQLAADPGINADLLLIRGTQEPQYAIARSSDGTGPGAVAGAVAAAAVLADQMPSTWIGIFPLDDGGYWYLAVRSGVILPQGDSFYEDEAAVRERFAEDTESASWERYYVPQGWHPEATTLDIANQLADATQPTLKPLKILGGKLPKILLAGIAAAAILFAVQFFLLSQEPEPVTIPKLEAMPQATTFTPGHFTKPRSLEVIAACIAGMQAIDKPMPGFSLASIDCDGKTTTYTYANDNGTIDWARRWLDQLKLGRIGFDIDSRGEIVTVTLPMKPLTVRGKEGAHGAKAIREAMIGYAQATQASLELSDPVPQKAGPAMIGQAAPAQPDVWVMTYELSSAALEQWGAVLADIEGLTVTHVSWNQHLNTFTLSGEIYVRQ